jgi:hypothetical protein
MKGAGDVFVGAAVALLGMDANGVNQTWWRPSDRGGIKGRRLPIGMFCSTISDIWSAPWRLMGGLYIFLPSQAGFVASRHQRAPQKAGRHTHYSMISMRTHGPRSKIFSAENVTLIDIPHITIYWTGPALSVLLPSARFPGWHVRVSVK